jgi:4-diphosphocytidyl-2C-methyl-D-erythritol kinase
MTEQRCECPSTNHGHEPNECHKAATSEDKRCDECREAEAKEAMDDVRRLAGAGRIFFAYCKTCKEGQVPLYEVPDAEKDPFPPADSKTAACPNCGAQHTYRPSEMHLGEK